MERKSGRADPSIKGKTDFAASVWRQRRTAASDAVIEILILDIKPGKRDQFHKLYERESLPLLKKWNIHVVAHGPSLHDANSYYVIRSFKSLQDRQELEDAFYNSGDWKDGPRTAILELVDHFAYTVIANETLQETAARTALP
jgi:hypothetical protein